jgi:hypothetical protein
MGGLAFLARVSHEPLVLFAPRFPSSADIYSYHDPTNTERIATKEPSDCCPIFMIGQQPKCRTAEVFEVQIRQTGCEEGAFARAEPRA